MWEKVKNYEDLYEVNEFGEIRSIKRLGTSGGLIKPTTDKNGYQKISLCKNGIQKTMSVHRVVYYSFFPNTDETLQINHKDENPSNNRLDNLEAITQKENLNYGTRNERISVTNSDLNGNFQKNISKQIKCYEYPSMKYLRDFNSTKQVERELGIFHSHVSKCCKNIYKQINGYTFRYA